MNTLMKQPVAHRQAGGFTLIELMIAMVLGLIVIGAVLALSLSMIRANSDTIAATRLTQELRATSASIASELNRAGSSENPFNLTAAAALGTVTLASANKCVIYSYSKGGVTVNRAISWAGDSVYMGTTACGAGGTKLSSSQVKITNLVFTRSGRTLTVNLTGEVPSKPSVYRQYSQTVFAPGLGT